MQGNVNEHTKGERLAVVRNHWTGSTTNSTRDDLGLVGGQADTEDAVDS